MTPRDRSIITTRRRLLSLIHKDDLEPIASTDGFVGNLPKSQLDMYVAKRDKFWKDGTIAQIIDDMIGIAIGPTESSSLLDDNTK